MSRRLAIASSLLAALLTILALAPAGALAQRADTTPKTTLYEIESQVMCVTCRTSLAVAGGPQAERQRELIRGMIAAGMTTDEIKSALVDEYGKAVLALPEEDGFNVAVYVVPVAVVAVALALAAIFLPRWRRRARAFAGAEPTALGPELSDEDARRLDEDLKRYD
ncbi:cytochrome c-type biogenesis protein [Conexibacter arvalis]|uniref:Cytochrome c-type biogenesis protein n=1 Tax=Conexibacter arvalis TaxID=912552 RepID=A0A840IHS1_9ACTN|nr:cytochrome c-type biogenesis protein CcmH [Conexibacter arvalis]MBB4664512.1 cytochrome c-type biogenesis protein CcmH/NrfF [Conexibacter arvalis]